MHTYKLQTQNSLKQTCIHESRTRKRTTETHRKILAPLESNYEVDLTSHYKGSNALQYHMHYNVTKLRSMTYYPLHVDSS